MVDPAIVSEVRDYLRHLSQNGLAVSFGVVFGSQVTGAATPLSDIDVIVVSPEFDGTISRQRIDQLWRMAARTNSRIEPIPCGERQWGEDSANAIIEIARTEGWTVKLGEQN